MSVGKRRATNAKLYANRSGFTPGCREWNLCYRAYLAGQRCAAPARDPLVGLTEIALGIGVPRQVISNWRVRDPSFPKPYTQLAMGPIWRLEDIQRWNAEREAQRKER